MDDGGRRAGGVVARYAFGLRYEVWRRHRAAPGFRVLASELRAELPPAGVNVTSEMLSDRYCLCPSGAGWGMRATQAVSGLHVAAR